MTHQRKKPPTSLLWFAPLLVLVFGCDSPLPMSPLEQARAAFANGQWAESIMFSTEAISRHPDDIPAYVLRGRAFRRLGQFEPAITDFTVAIHLDPKNPEYYYLRADAYKLRAGLYDKDQKYKDQKDLDLADADKQKDLDLADADNKAGQKLDPSFQRAYLYAPLDGSLGLPAVAAELSRTLRDDDNESADDPNEFARRPRKRPSARRAAALEATSDSAADDPIESVPAQTELSDESEIKDIYGLPVATELNRPAGGLFAPGSINSGPGANGRPGERRKPIAAQLDRPALAENAEDPPAAQQGRSQRGSGNSASQYYPPQRSLHPFGSASMRPTGVPSDQPEEEFAAEEPESGEGGRGRNGGGGSGGRLGSPQFGGGNPSAMGGRGYGAPLDPYGGYTRSARPTGAMSNPYGPPGAQGSASRRRGSVPRDAESGTGGAPPNPYGPMPAAPVPYIEPPGLRYD